jgi:hypothetical protein
MLSALVAAQPSAAQGIIAADMAVSSIVEKLRAAAQDVIQQLGQVASVNSFQIRQHVLLAISEMEHSALTIETKTFKDIDSTQQSLFRNVESTIAEARRAATASLQDANKIALNVESAVARLPLASKSPRVTNIRPDHLLSPSASQPVRLIVEGNFLAYGPSTLTMDKQDCPIASQTDTSLVFLCPATIFRTADSFRNVTGSLTVADYKEFWERIKGVFRHYDPKKIYRSLVVAVPPKIGTYSLEVNYNTQTQTTIASSAPFDSGNPHCTGQRDYSNIYSVQHGAGYSIVPGSITFAESSGNAERSMAGPLDFTPAGFRMQSTIKNSGSCGPDLPFGAGRSWYDARAWMAGTVSWTEVITNTVAKQETVQSGDITWGSDIAIILPSQLNWLKLTITQIDGTKPVVIGEDNNQRWFKVQRAGNVLKISPRQVEEALKL